MGSWVASTVKMEEANFAQRMTEAFTEPVQTLFLEFKVFSKPKGKRCMLDYINDTNISIVYCFIVK